MEGFCRLCLHNSQHIVVHIMQIRTLSYLNENTQEFASGVKIQSNWKLDISRDGS